MASSREDKVFYLLNGAFEFIKRLLFKTLTRTLLTFSFSLITIGYIGFYDVVIYGIDIWGDVENPVRPTNEVGFFTYLGIVIALLVLTYKGLEQKKENKSELRANRNKLKKEWASLHDVDLEDQFEEYFFVKTNAPEIKLALGSNYKRNYVIDLFLKAHLYVEIDGDWFKPSERFLKFRHVLGYFFLAAIIVFWVPIFGLFCIYAYTYFIGGDNLSDFLGFLFNTIFIFVACIFLKYQNDNLGNAITLIEKMRPREASDS